MFRPEDSSDQIDLTRYAAAVSRRWKLVAITTALVVVAAIVSTVVLARVAPRYQAEVTVLLTGPRYRINFDPKFANVDSVATPAAARVEEYRTIANSPEVRLATIQALSGQLTPEDVGTVAVNALVRGQLITVMASAEDPDRAILVGNAYASAVANRLDAVYGQTEQDRQAIAKKLAETAAAHQEAQNQFTAFTRESRVDALAIQIAQKEAVMQSLAEEQASFVKNRLAGFYGTLAETDQIVRAAGGLRDQVQAATNASAPVAGASLSLATLQARLAALGTQTNEVHVGLSRDSRSRERDAQPPSDRSPTERIPTTTPGSRTTSPPQLQLQLNADSLTRMDADPRALLTSIDSLIASARSQQDDIRRAIDELSRQIASGNLTREGSTLDATIAQLASELSAVQADYHQAVFRRDILMQNVEQARSTRTTLEAKLSEANVAAEAGGGAAIVASGPTASLPRVWPPSLSRSLPFTAVAGLLIGVIVALIMGRGDKHQPTTKRLAEGPSSASAAVAR
jgi:capsular polysaccharide biosynthesis protein